METDEKNEDFVALDMEVVDEDLCPEQALFEERYHTQYKSYVEIRKAVATCRISGQLEFWSRRPAVNSVKGRPPLNGLAAINHKAPTTGPLGTPRLNGATNPMTYGRPMTNGVRGPVLIRTYRASADTGSIGQERSSNVISNLATPTATTAVRNVLYNRKQGVILVQNGVGSSSTQPQNIRVYTQATSNIGAATVANRNSVVTVGTPSGSVALANMAKIAQSGPSMAANFQRQPQAVPENSTAQVQQFIPNTSAKSQNLSDGNQTHVAGSTVSSDSSESLNVSGSTKTFPSLVVVVKPSLHIKPHKSEISSARTTLDQIVKNILMKNNQQFVEWLLTRKLVKLVQKCYIHRESNGQPVSLKLAKSLNTDDPVFYGGYAWIAECCGKKTVSIFEGSIFDPSAYPPHTVLKLIYHWSCQTAATSVINWCKVKESYLKNFYTLLRSVCVAALYELCPMLGGPSKVVEIGLVTLGAAYTGQNGKKQFQVEILGAYDPLTRIVRLKVILPTGPGQPGETVSSKTRSAQLLDALKAWVDPNSKLVIDSSVDKTVLVFAGFLNVVKNSQSSDSGSNVPRNDNIVNYLKNVIPKMFQTTLCVLSKMLIQHFLDELTWRERWGQTANSTFNSLLDHLQSLTQTDYSPGGNLVSYLNKISVNPFQDWRQKDPKHTPSGIDLLPDSIRSLSPPSYIAQIQTPRAQEQTSPTTNQYASTNKQRFTIPELSITLPNKNQVPSKAPVHQKPVKRKHEDISSTSPAPVVVDELLEYFKSQTKSTFLEAFYYAESKPLSLENITNSFPEGLKCPLCLKSLTSNNEVYRHIFAHVAYIGRNVPPSQFCKYCLKDTAHPSLQIHTEQEHKSKKKNCCWICLEEFASESKLVIHMWENHNKSDMPYKCQVCNYSSSFHADVVDHFHQAHSGKDVVLCPLCLEVFPAKSVLCMQKLTAHVQLHQDRRGKKCSSCCLVFSNPADSKSHVTDCHMSEPPQPSNSVCMPYQLKIQEGTLMAKPPVLTKKYVAFLENSKEKLKQESRKPNAPRTTIIEEDECSLRPFQMSMNGAEGTVCLECHTTVESTDHFPGVLRCLLCRFSTCCKAAIHQHHKDAHPTEGPKLLRPIMKVNRTPLLKTPLKCRCGFESCNPNRMAFHLQKCQRTKVVPVGTEFPELASETVAHSESNANPPSSSIGDESSQDSV